jgi:hypothetical protein
MFYKTHAQQLEKLEKTKCDCKTKEYIHTGWCNLYANKIQTEDDKPCQCVKKIKKNHLRNCKYSTLLRSVVAEWTITPILGFNSGKYDMLNVLSYRGCI